MKGFKKLYQKIYAIPGWGFDERAFSSFECEIEVIDWQYLLEKRAAKFSDSIFIGWSLGGYLAIDKIEGDGNIFLLVACGDCFSYKSEKKYGVDSKLIFKLKDDIKHDKQATLQRFYSTVFSPNGVNEALLPQKIAPFSEEKLIEGLDYLDNVSFSSEVFGNKNVRFFLGKKDAVIDRRMAIFLKRNNQFLADKVHILEEAGHFITDYKQELLKNIL